MTWPGLLTGPRVRVQRNGNSKVLPLPAELARAADVDFGEVYTVELVGDDVIYHRTTPQAHVELRGEGALRFGVLPDDGVTAAPQRAGVPPLDWDF